MRHNKKGRKLGTDYSHTKAMKRSLVSALFLNDRIKTVESRAKEIRPQVDKVITWAKRGDLHSRRLAIAYLNDKELVREIFEKVAQGMFQDRPGGYTRIMKLGPRKGDNAPMVIMELVTEPCVPKAERKAAAEKKAAAKKAAPKKVAKKADQADQRRHHDGDSRQKQRRHLIADGFARTGGHHRQHILPVQQPPDDVLLPGAETVVAKNFFQDRMRVCHGRLLRFSNLYPYYYSTARPEMVSDRSSVVVFWQVFAGVPSFLCAKML